MIKRLLTFIYFFTISVFWVEICFASFDAIGAALDTANGIVENVGGTIEKASSEFNKLVSDKVGLSVDINVDTKKIKKLEKQKKRLDRLDKKYQKAQAAYQKGMRFKADKEKKMNALKERIAEASKNYEKRLAEYMKNKDELIEDINEAKDQINTVKDNFEEVQNQIDGAKEKFEESQNQISVAKEKFEEKASALKNNNTNKVAVTSSKMATSSFMPTEILGEVTSANITSAIQSEAYQQQTIIPSSSVIDTSGEQFINNEVSVEDVERLMETSDIQIVESPVQFTDMNISDQIKQLGRSQTVKFKDIEVGLSDKLMETEAKLKSSRSGFSNANAIARDELFSEATDSKKNIKEQFQLDNKEMINE